MDAVTAVGPAASPISSGTIRSLVEPATMPPTPNSPAATQASVEIADASEGHLNTSIADVPAPHPPIVADAQVASRISPKQEVQVAKEEIEVAPIRITIGRVVVRATPAAPTPQPVSSQKRILRPVQSLSEYLK